MVLGPQITHTRTAVEFSALALDPAPSGRKPTNFTGQVPRRSLAYGQAKLASAREQVGQRARCASRSRRRLSPRASPAHPHTPSETPWGSRALHLDGLPSQLYFDSVAAANDGVAFGRRQRLIASRWEQIRGQPLKDVPPRMLKLGRRGVAHGRGLGRVGLRNAPRQLRQPGPQLPPRWRGQLLCGQLLCTASLCLRARCRLELRPGSCTSTAPRRRLRTRFRLSLRRRPVVQRTQVRERHTGEQGCARMPEFRKAPLRLKTG